MQTPPEPVLLDVAGEVPSTLTRQFGGSTRGDVIFTTATDITVSVVGMVASMVSARLLLVEGRGELAAIITFSALLGALASLGLSDALVFFSARNPGQSGRQLGTSMVLASIGSLFFAALGYVLVPVVLASQSADIVQAARWYLVSIPVVAVGTSLIPQVLRGVGDYVWWNLVRATPFVAWLVVLVFAAVTGTDDPGRIALWFLMARAALVLPCLVVVCLRIRQTPRPTRALADPLLRYGLPLMVSTVPYAMNLRLDQLLIPAFLGAEQLGLYVVGIGWASIVLPFQRGLGSVFFPKVAKGEGEQAYQTFAQGSRIGLLTTLALIAIVLPLTPVLLPVIFGESFRDSIPVAMLLVVAALPSGWNWVLTGGLRGLGASKSVMWSEFTGMIVTFALLPVGLKVAGIEGAALASIAGYSTVTVTMIVLSGRITGLSWKEAAIPRRADVELILRQVRRRGK